MTHVATVTTDPCGASSPHLLPPAHGDDDGVVHGDAVNRTFRAVFVGVVARWSAQHRAVVVELATADGNVGTKDTTNKVPYTADYYFWKKSGS